MMSTSPAPVAIAQQSSSFAVSGIARKVFSFPVLLGALLAGGATVASRFNLPDPDMWSHIAIGKQILENHTWPLTDTYSLTAHGNDSLAFEWLGEVVIALAARAGGLAGLTALLAALSAALTLLLYYFAYRRSGNAKAAFVSCFVTLPLAAAFFTLRPQLLGYIFLVIALIALEAFRQGRWKWLWALPPLFLVWVNTHGSFILGLMVIGLYWVSGLVRLHWGDLRVTPWTRAERIHLELVSLFSLLALAVTPYGTRLAGFTLHVIFHAPLGMANITEYQPLGASGQLLRILLLLLLSFLLLHLLIRPAYRMEELLLFPLALCGACVHSRLVFLLALSLAPLLAVLLSHWVPAYDARVDRPALNALLIILLGAAMIRFLPSRSDVGNEVADRFPLRAVEYLRRHPAKGPMLNDYGWGGFLILTAGSEQKVFIDGRSQLYEEAGVYSDYLRVMFLDPATLSLLRKYNVQSCLIRRDAPLAALLVAQPDWQTVYSDSLAVLLVRKRQA